MAEQYSANVLQSVISEAELRYGVAILPAGMRRDRLAAEIEGMLREDFAGRILTFDSESARAYAVIAADRRRVQLRRRSKDRTRERRLALRRFWLL